MKNRPPAYLKSVAAELAALIHTGSSDKRKMQELQNQLQYDHLTPDTFISTTPSGEDVDSEIGIWKRVMKNGHIHYERDIKKKTDWHLWANVHILYPKSTKKRVVL